MRKKYYCKPPSQRMGLWLLAAERYVSFTNISQGILYLAPLTEELQSTDKLYNSCEFPNAPCLL